MNDSFRRWARRVRACALATAAATAALGSLPAQAQAQYEVVPLRESAHAGINDSFYSINHQQHKVAVSQGYIDRGTAGWLPCSRPDVAGPQGQAPVPSAADANLGYASIHPMNFGCLQPAQSRPLYRMYRGAPATDHFYTTFANEAHDFQLMGWSFERVEGYLFLEQSPALDRVPVFRMSRCLNGEDPNCDWEHRIAFGERKRDALMYDGWVPELLLGWAFDGYNNNTAVMRVDGMVNGQFINSAAPVTMLVQDARPPKINQDLTGFGRNPLYGSVVSNSTSRPPGAVKQRMIFTFHTGSLFDAGKNFDHVSALVHFHAQLGSDGLPTVPYDGLGLFIAPANWSGCGLPAGGGQVFVELATITNYHPGPTDARRTQVDCSSKLKEPLAPQTWYKATVTVSDAADVTYRIERVSDGTKLTQFTKNYASSFTCPVNPPFLEPRFAYCANAMPALAFARERTGYAVMPVFKTSGAWAKGTLGPVTVQWLDANDGLLWQR